MKRSKSAKRPPKRRRPAPARSPNSQSPSVPAATPRVDALSGLIEVTVHQSVRDDQLRDEAVISVIRSELEGRPLGEGASQQALVSRFRSVAERDGVSQADYRKALQSFGKTAAEHRAPDHPRAFLSYLEVMTN